MATDRPNLKFDHVFAIIRLDQDLGDGQVLSANAVTVTKVLRSKERAEQEVSRLNALNSDKNCTYIYQITRLEKVDTSGEV